MKRIVLVLLAVGFFGVAAQAETYNIDPYHSSVSFKVKHVVGKVTGHFDKFTGTFNYDAAKPDKAAAQAIIETASINTGIDKRDNHLRSPDFFDAQKFPMLTFKSTGVTEVNGSSSKLHGDLTMHGVTKPVVLDLVFEGVAKDPMSGGNRAGATATGHVNRQDFVIGASSGPMAGMVGSDIEITIEVEGVSKK
jgi:polyisoprenoid-binding protein YceI